MSIKRNKIFVIFLLIFSPIIKGQINKGNFLFSLNGNYIKASKEDGTSMNYISSNFKDLYIGSKISYVINNKFFIGVGLDYYWNKKHKQSFLQIIDKLLQLELNDIKSEALIPNFTFSFYNSISSKFFITLNFKTGFGQIFTSTSKVICYMSILSLDSSKFYPLPPNSSCYYIENEKISKFDLLDLHLYPELIYFLNSNISLAMEIGGIEYVMYE